MAKAKTNKSDAMADDRAPKRQVPAPTMTHADIARRAYDLFLARGCKHGYDVEDWLRAERELTDVLGATVA
jgi:hypothetical protein